MQKKRFLKSLLMMTTVGSLLTTNSVLASLPAGSDWTGYYASAGVGYGMLNQNSYIGATASQPITALQTSGGKGWLGRVGAAYKYQLASRYVMGAFADYDFTDLFGEHSFPGAVGKEEQTSAWYVGGLLGYTFTPGTLTFIDAGYTGTHLGGINYLLAIAGGGPTGITLASQTYEGWFVGLGMETLLATWKTSNLFLRAEYRYSGYGAENIPLGGAFASNYIEHSTVAVQTVTPSLVWRFS